MKNKTHYMIALSVFKETGALDILPHGEKTLGGLMGTLRSLWIDNCKKEVVSFSTVCAQASQKIVGDKMQQTLLAQTSSRIYGAGFGLKHD